jgi:hypothetical protein
MGVLGFIVSQFIFSRVHMRTRLGLGGAAAATLLILVIFTYLSTYYVPPEGIEAAVALERVAEMNARRLFLIAGEILGMAAYLFKVYRAGNSLKA